MIPPRSRGKSRKLVVGTQFGTRNRLGPPIWFERRLREDRPGLPQAGEKHAHVLGIRKIVRSNRRRLERVRRNRDDRAAACRPHRADSNGHAPFPLERTESRLGIARRREQQLQVGARETLPAPAKRHGAGHAECESAPAREHPFADFTQKRNTAAQLIDRKRISDPVADPRYIVVLQISTDTGQVMANINPDRLQMRRRSDSRDLQEMR